MRLVSCFVGRMNKICSQDANEGLQLTVLSYGECKDEVPKKQLTPNIDKEIDTLFKKIRQTELGGALSPPDTPNRAPYRSVAGFAGH